MIIQARFSSSQTGLGYQFYSAAGTLLGSRITAGIVSLPETGSYAADATVPATAVGVFWNSDTSQATEDLREALATPDVPSAAAIADEVRVELATELARIDATVSSRNATAPDNAGIAAIKAKTDNLPSDPADQSLLIAAIDALPTEAEIIAAAGGLSVEAAAALEAADQILLVDLYTRAAGPELVIPAPSTDESLTVCYIYTEDITNVARAGIALEFKLVSTPAKSERVLETATKTVTTDATGYAQITLQSDLRYRLTSKDLGWSAQRAKIFTPTGATFDLLTLIP